MLKNISAGMYLDIHEPVQFKLGIMMNTTEPYNYFDTRPCDLELDSRSQGCKKVKTSVSSPEETNRFGLGLACCLGLLVLMNLIVILSSPVTVSSK